MFNGTGKAILALTGALSLLVLGACATVITHDHRHSFYEPDLVRYVAAQGSFPVVVIANPFGPGADDALLATMHLPGFYQPTPLSKTTPKARDDGHLILVFNPMRTSDGHGACTDPASQAAATAPDAAGVLRIQAAFCYDQEVVSEALMETPRPAALDDPAFGDAMAQLLNTLLPNERPDGGDCITPGNINC